MSHSSVPVLPTGRMDNYDQNQVVDYLSIRHARNKNLEFGVCQYTHGATVTSYGYLGGVYSPTQNRIYLVPTVQSGSANWHYIDCGTGAVVAYAHGVAGLDVWAFCGGVYVPDQDRIYLVPHGNTGVTQTTWYYIDCRTGNVIPYTSIVPSSAGAYVGGVYSPKQNRIYLIPFAENTYAWAYINCTSTPTTGSYAHTTLEALPYFCGGYSPLQDRIYYAPYGLANQPTWHYMDCTTGVFEPYTHGATATIYAYNGMVWYIARRRIAYTLCLPLNQTSPFGII